MAIKISELSILSTITNATVFPVVEVIDSIPTTLQANIALLKTFINSETSSNLSAISIDIDTLYGNAGAQSTVISQLLTNAAVQSEQIANVNVYVVSTNVSMKGYVDGQISTTSSLIATANTNMKGYVDLANTIQSNQISGANSAITTANTNMKGYVDLANTIQSNQIAAANSAITTANTNMKGYVDGQLTILSSSKISANSSNVTVTASYVNVAVNSSNVASFSSVGGNLTALAVTGAVTINSSGAATAIFNGAADGIGNIGAPGDGFNTVFAKATSAQYADLAENYLADATYPPGTVVEFGGEYEITLCNTDMSSAVAGVISTNPAYLMNNSMVGDCTAAVALQGRVHTRVIGKIVKGSMLVSAGNGLARAETNPSVGTVIGKSLENYDSTTEGIIEVVVGVR